MVVAADGAGSAIRKVLAIETEGPGDLGHFVNVMFRAAYGQHLRDRPAILYQALTDEYFETFVAVNGDDLWLMHHFRSLARSRRTIRKNASKRSFDMCRASRRNQSRFSVCVLG